MDFVADHPSTSAGDYGWRPLPHPVRTPLGLGARILFTVCFTLFVVLPVGCVGLTLLVNRGFG